VGHRTHYWRTRTIWNNGLAGATYQPDMSEDHTGRGSARGQDQDQDQYGSVSSHRAHLPEAHIEEGQKGGQTRTHRAQHSRERPSQPTCFSSTSNNVRGT
jgi:hypothetical protein